MKKGGGILYALLGFLALIAGTSPAGATRVLTSPEMATGSGIEMKITSAYEEIPDFGYLPVRVVIKNNTNAAHTWNLDSSNIQASVRSTTFYTTLSVEAETEKIFDLLVPLAPQFESYRRYSNLTVSIAGYGVTSSRNGNMSSGSRGGTPTPFVGMGEGLSVKNWGTLRENLEKKHSKTLEGTSLDPDFLPADWRGLAGFSVVFFTDEEWRRIAAAPKGAIQDWLAQGGMLVLYATGSAQDLPPVGNVGSGSIEIWQAGEEIAADGTKLDANAKFVLHAAKLLDEDKKSPIEESLAGYNQTWQMAEKVGQSEPPQLLILGFVLIFGGVVGPLNFLVLAPAGSRHRLFWTTPLISLVASLLLAAFILLSEGFGGKGLRFEAELSLPAAHKEVLWQEQVSRTGILVSGAFAPSEPCLLLPLSLKAKRPRMERSNQYSLNGTTWSGDWFRNRTTQGQLLTAVSPTRGRLEITTDASGTPTAVSSFEKVLQKCWYLDAAGKTWSAENLAPGEKKAMQSIKVDEYNRAWSTALKPAGPVIVEAARAFTEGTRADKFFATTGATLQPISTLPAIRWQDTGGLIFGIPAR